MSGRWAWLGDERGPGAGAMRVARACLAVLAFAVPFSIAITEAALVLGIVALLVARRRGRPWRFATSPLDWACLGLVASWLIASAFSPEPLGAFLHTRKLYALGLIYLAAEGFREPGLRARFVPLVLAGATVTALVGFLIFAVKVRSDPSYRLQSLLSNQMTSGGVLAATCLWALGQLTVGRVARRVAYAGMFALLGAALALTQTRSPWMGFAAGAAVLLVARAPRAWWTLPAAVVAFRFVAPARLLMRVASIVDPHEPGNQGRLSMWRSGWDIFRERPLTGAGVQDLLALYRKHKYPDATFEAGHFHNNFVQFAVSAGVLGLAAFIGWCIAGYRQLLRARRAAAGDDRALAASGLAVFSALLVSGMFDFTFGDAEVVYHSYLALGLALALLPERTNAGMHGGR